MLSHNLQQLQTCQDWNKKHHDMYLFTMEKEALVPQ